MQGVKLTHSVDVSGADDEVMASPISQAPVTNTYDCVTSTIEANSDSSNYQSLPPGSQSPLADSQGTKCLRSHPKSTGRASSNPPVETRGQGIYTSMSEYFNTLRHHNALKMKVYQVDFTNSS